MKFKFKNSWTPILKDEFDKAYFQQLESFIQKETQLATVFPPENKIFAAFNKCNWDNLKVIIIGQDPYHGPGQANGLSFSVSDGIPLPPSLSNIFKEIHQNSKIDIPTSGNLERWAEQGVLLLNAVLTVRKGEPNSHQNKGWELFTDSVIQSISSQKENIVFLLWGGFAKKKTKLIDKQKHYILEAGHPSPLSANRGFWFGNQHFSKTNDYLNSINKKIINW